MLAYEQCDELDVVGPFAVLQTANRYLAERPAPTPVLKIVALGGSGAVCGEVGGETRCFVTGIHGITLGVEPWDGAELPDLLIVAGGNIDGDAGIMHQMRNAAFTGPIARQHARGMPVVSVCTGAFGLVGAGIARGRRMTTHPALVDMLAQDGVDVLDPDWEARVVDDGDIISCGGVTSGIDLALYLVRSFWQDPQLENDVRAFVDFLYRSPAFVAGRGSGRQ